MKNRKNEVAEKTQTFLHYAMGAYHLCKREKAPFDTFYHHLDKYTATHFSGQIEAHVWHREMEVLRGLYNGEYITDNPEFDIESAINEMLHGYKRAPEEFCHKAKSGFRIPTNPATPSHLGRNAFAEAIPEALRGTALMNGDVT